MFDRFFIDKTYVVAKNIKRIERFYDVFTF